jgi:hypothetical protein
MPHDFGDLFAELDEAKANLGRSVRKCRSRIARSRTAREPLPAPTVPGALFSWPESEER